MSSLYGSAVTNETLGGNVAMVTCGRKEKLSLKQVHFIRKLIYTCIFFFNINKSIFIMRDSLLKMGGNSLIRMGGNTYKVEFSVRVNLKIPDVKVC